MNKIILDNGYVTIIDASSIIGVSSDTIRRWDKKGLIKSWRNQYNHRIFKVQELERLKRKYQGIESDHKHKVLVSRKKTNYNVIELFAGCGGLALGLHNSGLKTEVLVELDKNCVETLNTNAKRRRWEWEVIHDDIKNVNLDKYKNKVDILTGGFPCQAFSYAGLGMGFEDTRGTLFFEFAKKIQEVNPKIILAENVRGLVSHDEGRTLKTILYSLEELGYSCTYKILRSQFLDVPQKRERLIIIGHKKELDMRILFPKEKDYIISLSEALKECPESIGSKYPKRKKEILSKIPEGGNWRDLDVELQKEHMGANYYRGGGRTGMARRLSMHEPSLTLTCSPAQKQTERCHPKETRPLNIREYARIQTFPDNWEFIGSVASQYKQIGNAVPVNLAYNIGKCLVAMLDGTFNEKTMVKEEAIKFPEEQLSFAKI